MGSVPRPAGCEERCPGCSHRDLSAEESLVQKKNWLGNKLASWASALEEIRAPSEKNRLGYRNKTTLRADWSGERWKFGLLARVSEGDDYEVVDIPECPVHSRQVREIVRKLSVTLPGPEILPLAFLVISGDLVTLVVKSREIPMIAFRERIGPVLNGLARGLLVNLNPSAGERVFSSKNWKTVWGSDRSIVDGMIYGPASFQQLIAELHSDALSEAERFFGAGSGDSVIDLCSGIGVSLKRWKDRGARVVGVELNGEAVECSEKSVGPGACLRGRASDRLPQLEEWRMAAASERLLVFANPPRLGLESEATEWLIRSAKPEKIAYLSCSAGTLARDLSVFSEAGYAVRRIIPYDFFPQTHHVETLALLERQDERRR